MKDGFKFSDAIINDELSLTNYWDAKNSPLCQPKTTTPAPGEETTPDAATLNFLSMGTIMMMAAAAFL